VAAGQPEAALADFRRAVAFSEAAAIAEQLGRSDEAALLGALTTLVEGLDRLSGTDLDALANDEAGTLSRRLREAADRLERLARRRRR